MDRYNPMGSEDSPPTAPRQLPAEPGLKPEMPTASEPDQEEPSRLDYIKSVVPPSKPRRKWPLIVLLVLIVVALVAAGGYWFAKHRPATSHKPSAPKSSVPAVTPIDSSTAGTPQYISNGNDLNLDFNYPSNWTVSPASNDNKNDQPIMVTSPLTSIPGTSGSTVTGKVVVSIRPSNSELGELNSGASAAQASAQIAYTKPTSSQHQYPYLTFLHIGSGTATPFQEVIVTGTVQFAQGTRLSESSISVDPIISASFYSCTTQICTGSGEFPLAVTNDTWQNTAVFQQTLDIFQSMQLN